MPKSTLLSLTLALLLALTLAACEAAPAAPGMSDAAAPSANQIASGSDSTEPGQNETPAATQPADDNPTPVPPTATASATPTLPPSPTPTTTPTATPEPVVIEGITLAEAEIYAGPSDIYPWMGTYTTGITLTVMGSDDSLSWLAVEIPPGQIGWVAEQDLQLDFPKTDLPLAPTPEALPTVAPLAGSTIQLTLVKHLYPASEYFHSVQAAIAVVQTNQPKTPFTLEMFNEKGKLMFREKNMTDAAGKQSIYIPWRQAEGKYRVVVTNAAGDYAEGWFEVIER